MRVGVMTCAYLVAGAGGGSGIKGLRMCIRRDGLGVAGGVTASYMHVYDMCNAMLLALTLMFGI